MMSDGAADRYSEPPAAHRTGTEFAQLPRGKGRFVMSLVRLLGFTTLSCGCVVGRYREVATNREVAYVEEKGKSCTIHGHRRNHTIIGERGVGASATLTSKAS